MVVSTQGVGIISPRGKPLSSNWGITVRTCFHATATVLSLLLASTSLGSLVYEQLPPGLGADSWNMSNSSTLDNFGGTPGFRTADDFQLSIAATITDVHWWGESNSGGDNFTFTFYDNNAGEPGNILLATTGSLNKSVFNVGSFFFPYPLTFYESDLTTPFVAAANTVYWLSIFNSAADASWKWLSANAAGNGSIQDYEPPPPWRSGSTDDRAFQLTDATAIPEVSPWLAWASLVIGLVAVSWGRKIRQAASGKRRGDETARFSP
jgi:hypothetical protein